MGKRQEEGALLGPLHKMKDNVTSQVRAEREKQTFPSLYTLLCSKAIPPGNSYFPLKIQSPAPLLGTSSEQSVPSATIH